MSPTPPDIPILFENNDLVVVNKPEGISSIPERAKEIDTVLTLLTIIKNQKIFVVHRLDRDVSGLLVFAKNEETHKYLCGLFEKRDVKKTYMAVVHGEVKTERGEINKPLRQFGSGRMGVNETRGKDSTTRYDLEKTNGQFSMLKVFPESGRRHQIRVHLYSIGHPIVGDPLYGKPDLQKQYARLLLHANEIEIPLQNGEKISVRASLPPSFRSIMDKILSDYN